MAKIISFILFICAFFTLTLAAPASLMGRSYHAREEPAAVLVRSASIPVRAAADLPAASARTPLSTRASRFKSRMEKERDLVEVEEKRDSEDVSAVWSYKPRGAQSW
ncbi:hypothetical protein BDZ89DRAFT_1165193 [Hymenopellis radicata]|nr:hypothetical protein BDZ89DRAFT_1165193 [Hymenopellis radicata]